MKMKSITNFGLGVFEVDEKIFLFKRSQKKNVFIIDYSSDGYEFETFSTKATIARNQKLVDISKTSEYRVVKLSRLYLLLYLKSVQGNPILFYASSEDLIDWEEKGKVDNIESSALLMKPSLGSNKFTVYYGKKNIQVSTTTDFEIWKKNKKSITKGESLFTVLSAFSEDRGTLLLYAKEQISNKNDLMLCGLLINTNHEKLWENEHILWKRTNQWVGKKVKPLGVVRLGDKIVSYWEVENEIYALSHPNFEKVFTAHPHKSFHPQLNKHSENPILEPGDNSWESVAVFNPAAVYDEGKVHLVYRAIGDTDTSVWGYSNSEDGVNFEDRECPIYLPRKEFELNNGEYCALEYVSGGRGGGGCEDPRITKIDDKFYVTYAAYDGRSAPKIALTSIDRSDFNERNWDKWADPKLISKPGEAHKNWVLFPEKFKGKFALLHSITPRVQVDYLDDLEFEDGFYVDSYFSPTERFNAWDSFMRGPGPPPIATNDGWLVFYHAMDAKDYGRYKIGAMLLDYDRPERILYRSKRPLIEPDRHYENNGLKPGVVFACGSAVVGDMLFVYYGGSDTNINTAYEYLPLFLKQLKASGSARLNIYDKS